MGNLQKRIRRAFVANPGARLTTVDLVRWAYPRLDSKVLHKHRYCVRLASEVVAVRVGRTCPGGFIWAAKPSHMLPSDKQRE